MFIRTTTLEADSKMILSYFVGGRDGECAMWFVDDLRAGLANRVQLTSDGHKAYLEAVDSGRGLCDLASMATALSKESTSPQISGPNHFVGSDKLLFYKVKAMRANCENGQLSHWNTNREFSFDNTVVGFNRREFAAVC